MGVEVSESSCWVRRATRRSWDNRPDWGKAGNSLEDIAKEKGFAVGVAEKRKEAKCGEGGKGNRRHINADRLRRGKGSAKILRREKGSAKIVIDYVDGGHEGMSGDNGMEEGVDGGKGSCVGPYCIPCNYLVSPYSPSYSPLS